MEKQQVLIKHFKKFKENKHQEALRRIKYKKNGDMQFGSAHRMVWAKGAVEPSGEDRFDPDLGTDLSYPNIERLFTDHADAPIALPVKAFYDLVTPLLGKVDQVYENSKKETKTRRVPISPIIDVRIEPSKLLLTPIQPNKHFVQASLACDTGTVDVIEFRIDTAYLKDALMLYKQLKINEVNLTFRTAVRPVMFHAGDVDYLIAPVRRG